MWSTLLTCLLILASTSVHARGINGIADPNSDPIEQIDTSPYDVSYTYKEADVYIPGSWFTKSISNTSLKDKHPVILYLHGSGGISTHSKKWAKFLSDNGFVVVMLDSFAIPGRERNSPLSSDLAKNGYNRSLNKLPFPTVRLRRGEVHYALEQLRQIPWVDSGAIFLMGHSEGGGSVARVNVDGLAGVIWSGYKCVGKRAIAVRPNVPVLAINHETDVWFRREGNPNCTRLEKFNNRIYAKELILPGDGHRTADNKDAQQEVLNFLEKFK